MAQKVRNDPAHSQIPPRALEGKKASASVWLIPFVALEWIFEWTAFALSNWSFLEVLEYLGTFSVLIAVIFYFSESGDRIKQRHYQAWQVINTAQGKGGSGGRIEALQELNADKVPLVGVDVSSAFLQGLQPAQRRPAPLRFQLRRPAQQRSRRRQLHPRKSQLSQSARRCVGSCELRPGRSPQRGPKRQQPRRRRPLRGGARQRRSPRRGSEHIRSGSISRASPWPTLRASEMPPQASSTGR